MANNTTPYSPLQAFIAPAWGRSEMWRIIVMILAFEFAFWLAPILVAALLPSAAAVTAYHEGTTTLASLAQFGTFGVTATIFIYILRRVHGRGFWSLFGDVNLAIFDIWRAGIAVGTILLVLQLIPPWIFVGPNVEMTNIIRWLFVLPFGMIVLIIQVGTEEIYFRGYLQQQFACLSASPMVWMLIPSCMFGVSHYWNGEGVADGVMWTAWATMLGLACADLTARTGALGAAIGLHLANNCFALFLVGTTGSPGAGLALFLYPAIEPQVYDTSAAALATVRTVLELMLMCLTVVVMWLAARIRLQR